MADMRERIESLSPRQLEVMQGVAERLSSKEIAYRLGLSPATVDSHIAAALQRLEFTSRRDAALCMIELGFLRQAGEDRGSASQGGDHEAHHGEDPRPQSSPVTVRLRQRILRLPGRFRATSGGAGGGYGGRSDGARRGPNPRGMPTVLLRYLLDAFYITVFFAVMSAGALGADWVVIQCEHLEVDPIVLAILRGVSYALAALGAIGVVTATGFLTFRFIQAIVKADD